MNQIQITRTFAALEQTRGFLAREQRYMPQHQNTDYIRSLNRHIEKLQAMVAAEVNRRWPTSGAA